MGKGRQSQQGREMGYFQNCAFSPVLSGRPNGVARERRVQDLNVGIHLSTLGAIQAPL